MILRTATIILAVFLFSAALLKDSTLPAFARTGSAPQVAEPAKKAEELFQAALMLTSTSNRTLARARLLQALQLWIEAGEPEKAARACLQMGDHCKRNKHYQESLHYYKQALEVKPPVAAAASIALTAIAQIYAELYQTDLAVKYYEKAISHGRAIKDISAQIRAWTGLANLHHQQGEREKAIKCIEQARALNRQRHNEGAEVDLAHLTGLINRERGLTEQAWKAFNEARAVYLKMRDKAGLVKVLCSISDLYLQSGQIQPALEQAEHALKLANEQREQAANSDDISEARKVRLLAYLSLARAQRAAGQKKLAVKSYELSAHDAEGLWWTLYINTEASAVAFRKECLVLYLELSDLLIEQGEIEKAYEMAEKARARAMMSEIEARRKGKPPKPASQEAVRELLQSIVRLRSQLVDSSLSPEQQEKIQNEIKNAESKLEEAKLANEIERSRDRMAWATPATVKFLHEQLTADDRLMVEFFLGEKRSFVWLITAKEIYWDILPGRKQIEQEVSLFIKLITTPPNNLYIERDINRIKERGEKLCSGLFGRLAEKIVPGRKITIVPDGLLHYLPFGALVRNRHYFLEDHEINYLPSPSMLNADPPARSGAGIENKMEFLAFGDPIFGPKANASGHKQVALGANELAQRVRAARGFNLARLPRTRDEVQDIANLFPADRQQVYLGKQSTEKAVKQGELRRFKRLHFATHSLIDERSPSRSAVVLTLDQDSEEDGFLEVSEIAQLDLDNELVVLSACQTGRGQLVSGEGVVGLSRAFLYAGAQSVIVSLWNVSDISTSQMMKNFYKDLINKAGSAAALRKAKLRMSESRNETRHPYYWAPFILIGKP